MSFLCVANLLARIECQQGLALTSPSVSTKSTQTNDPGFREHHLPPLVNAETEVRALLL